jgi:putative CocE/NonD family hydrolase
MGMTRRDWLRTTLAAIPFAALGEAARAQALPSGAAGSEPDSVSTWTLPLKRAVRVIENEWIPMPDGARLGVRLWIPEGADTQPVPVVLEYLPYRKRDGVRTRDEATAQNLAPYGLAFARIDIRGTGDSDGVMTDEYDEPELADAVDCIAWLAGQPWCNGAVGMRGISWGGINSLQVAARRPPALKAIMSMGSVDNRFTGDAHYIGGALATENFKWGTYFKVYMGAPPDPEISGPDWERKWHERLEASPPILDRWTSHQRYDAYWQRGSVTADYARIQCPVYIVNGWFDPYSNVTSTLLEGLSVPRKALVGPWGHLMPNLPQPLGLEWAHEEIRWWQQWLGGIDTGIMAEPQVRVYMPYQTLSEVHPRAIPGRWISEETWAGRRTHSETWYFGEHGMSRAHRGQGFRRVAGNQVVGLAKAQWMPSILGDQSGDDARSVNFDSAPLDRDQEILGAPQARIRVRSDAPVATLAVRLCEVTEAKSWLVTYGLLNLTHRDSHEQPTALQPDHFYDVVIPLYLIAHRFKKGSRIRLALSAGLWPLVWPSPSIATLTVDVAASLLELPVRRWGVPDAPFIIPEIHSQSATPYLHSEMGPGTEANLVNPLQRTEFPEIGTTVETESTEHLSMEADHANSSIWSQRNSTRWRRGEWDCTVSAEFELTSTATDFHLRESLRAKKGDQDFFAREQVTVIKRDLI